MATTHTPPPQTHFEGRRGFNDWKQPDETYMKKYTQHGTSQQERHCPILLADVSAAHPNISHERLQGSLRRGNFYLKVSSWVLSFLINHYIIVKKKSEQITPRLSRDLIYQKAHTYIRTEK